MIVARNTDYWAGAPKVERIRFTVVPDAITSALELKKGSADLASNVITLDMVHALESAHPKARYMITPHTYAAAFMRRALPGRLLDLVLSRS